MVSRHISNRTSGWPGPRPTLVFRTDKLRIGPSIGSKHPRRPVILQTRDVRPLRERERTERSVFVSRKVGIGRGSYRLAELK